MSRGPGSEALKSAVVIGGLVSLLLFVLFVSGERGNASEEHADDRSDLGYVLAQGGPGINGAPR